MSPVPATPAPVAPLRVLVVEDEPDVRWLVANRLERLGHAVATASDGQVALELAQADPPDAAVLDLMMPGLDGFALTRALRADERTCNVAVVILSARAGGADRRFAIEAGADDYLCKPLNPRELSARIQAAAGRR